MTAERLQSPAVEHDKQLVVRVPDELLKRLDAFVAAQKEQTGFTISRADAVRKLLDEGLSGAGFAAGKPRRGRGNTR